ncbi:MAG: anion permease [SAR116 cluster bacterium]|nr:anion permease [SAR116 cluster bacterium]|tara:strand:+ start:6392 stop:7891 length:1500 start_codon:yes stop_codon:yes gene_type:complete
MEKKDLENRYINDLKRIDYSSNQSVFRIANWGTVLIAIFFLLLTGVCVDYFISDSIDNKIILVIAAVIGGYMALNIGANDVANNMGPAVGGKVLTITTAVIIAAICEAAGALLAGGDVVKTVSKGIIMVDSSVSLDSFRYLMLSALLSAALWINLATMLNAPVSTTHSIVGGVLGGGLAAAGMNIVNWFTMGKIAASWVISPVLGGIIAALFLLFIKIKILNKDNKISAAKKWIPVLIALMAAAITAYMTIKGFKKIYKASLFEILSYTISIAVLSYLIAKPFVNKKITKLKNEKKDIYTLFNFPLIIGVCLLCFAHGANDVANAVGPLAAIVSTFNDTNEIASKVSIPFWVMFIGAVGISFGLLLFGPKLIKTVGQKITRLNAPRAYCVAISSAITVLIATTLGLPVSSTHIAIGSIFGIGFLREFLENPNKQKIKPGHKLNDTAEEAFAELDRRIKRKLVRRRFLYSIAAAWIITVPASALMSATIYFIISKLTSMA